MSEIDPRAGMPPLAWSDAGMNEAINEPLGTRLVHLPAHRSDPSHATSTPNSGSTSRCSWFRKQPAADLTRPLSYQFQRPQIADRLAAPLKHGQHHIVTALGGAGEGKPQSRNQQRLWHPETVITPTCFTVVTGDAVAQ